MNLNNQALRGMASWKKVLAHVDPSRLSQFWREVLIAVISAIISSVITWWLESPPSAVGIERLIANEANLALAHDLEDYGHLFDPDAWVIQVKKQAIWAHQNEIVDRLRPLRFTKLVHTPIQVSISEDGSSAFAQTYTTFEQVAPERVVGSGKEYWQFRKTSSGWKIVSFQYDLPE